MKWYFKSFIFLVALGNILTAQTISPKKPLTIDVDYSRFALSPDTAYVEVSYLLYPSGVTLEKNQDTLRGFVILHTLIKDSKRDSLIMSSSVSLPVIITDTSSLNLGIIWKSVFMLPVGIYELSVLGYDHRNMTSRDSVKRNFTIEKEGKGVWISDIDVCSRIVQSDDKKNPFYKNSYEVIPNPSLLFGGQSAPVVFSHAELYNLDPNSVYFVIAGIIDAKANFVKQKKSVHRYSARNVVDVNSLNVNSIQSGKYSYVLILADTLNHEIARSEKKIYIYNPRIPTQTSTIISSKSAEFAGLSDKELTDEFRKAQYIASTDDIKAFDKLTTIEGKKEFLVKFWTDRQNGQYGRTDITRSVYLDRVLAANQRYRAMGKDGWFTDRGRIFILYAEPDEVQRFPNSDDSKPYEVWQYYQIENGVSFVFVDRSGFGDYVLVHSTKRGELQDDQWQNYLR